MPRRLARSVLVVWAASLLSGCPASTPAAQPDLHAVGEGEPSHRRFAAALLAKGNVDIYLDPRKPGVRAPAAHMKGPQLVVKVGYALPVPIPDLTVDDHGVSGTLSFDGQPFACSIPWTSVFALVGEGGRGMVWSELIPPELRRAGALAP